MRLRTGLTGGLACALVLGGLAFTEAQQERRQDRSRTQVRTQERSRTTEVRRVSAVVGGNVEFSAGGSVGKIEDIVISDTGCIEYIVVVYHDRYVPIPWTVATVNFADRVVVIDIDEERFREVPTFTKDEFAVLSETDFTTKVHKSFNIDSARREDRETRRSFGPDRKSEGTKSKDRDSDAKAQDRGKSEDRPAPKGKEGDSKTGDSKAKESDKKPKDSDPRKDEKKPQ
jgi:hypothetical protein